MSVENIDTFSHKYRRGLVQKLTSTANKEERRSMLRESQQTFDYRLARKEIMASRKGINYTPLQIISRAEDQHRTSIDLSEYYIPNERFFSEFLPFTKGKTGAIVGVGIDQALDLFVNSRSYLACIIDATPTTILLSRLMMEVGVYHKSLFGRFPNVNEFLEYLKNDHLDHLRRIGLRISSRKSVEKLMSLLREGTSVVNMVDIENELPRDKIRKQRVYFYDYLSFKTRMKDKDGNIYGWCGTDRNLQRVFEAYEQGKIHFIHDNIYKASAGYSLKQICQDHDVPIDVVYLSNLEEYNKKKVMGTKHRIEMLTKNLRNLPFGKRAIFLRTANRIGADIKYSSYRNIEEIDERMESFYGIKAQSYHYSIQTVADWLGKVGSIENYPNLGWHREIEQGKALGIRQGVSLLGFSRDDLTDLDQGLLIRSGFSMLKHKLERLVSRFSRD